MLRTAAISILILAVLTLAPPADALLKGPLAPTLHPAAATLGPSGYDLRAAPGSHIVTHFKLSTGINMDVLNVHAPDGDVALKLRLRGSSLQVLDSGPTPTWVTLGSLSSHWQRVDVVLEGASALVSVNQGASKRATTAADAETGYVTFPETVKPIQRGLTRYDGAQAVAMDAFMSPLHDGGWTAVGDPARLIKRTQSSISHLTPGHLLVTASAVPRPAFLAVPVDALGGTYVAEVAVAAEGLLTPPTGMVVLAGLTGSLGAPSIQWEVRLDRDPAWPFGIHLVYHGADGTASVLSSSSDTAGTFWHVRAVVDEPAGRLAFVVDEATVATVIAPSGGLGASAWLAVGDLGLCLCDDARLGGAYFDDLAVVDIP